MKYNSKLAKTIDSCATIILIIGIILSIVEGIILIAAGNTMAFIGIGVIVLGILLSVIACLLVTGFARLIESTHNLEEHFCSPNEKSPNKQFDIYANTNHQAENRCPSCGSLNNPSAVFCLRCGTRLK